MMDNEMRIRRLMEEANDPTVALVMLDVVIGFGSHPNPASELAPAVARAKELAAKAGRFLEVIAVVTGTDEDPQNLNDQIDQLKQVGVWVETSNEVMVRYGGQILQALNTPAGGQMPEGWVPLDLKKMSAPVAGINVGLESFAENLIAQSIPAIHVDWRPPAGGNEKLMAILERMKKY
jgi:FdrA protein